jgi:hypothetical protein
MEHVFDHEWRYPPSATYGDLLRAQALAGCHLAHCANAPLPWKVAGELEVFTRACTLPRVGPLREELCARSGHLLRLVMKDEPSVEEVADTGGVSSWSYFDPFLVAAPLPRQAQQPPRSDQALERSGCAPLTADAAERWLRRRVSLLLGGLRDTGDAASFLTRVRSIRGILVAIKFREGHYRDESRSVEELESVAARLQFRAADWHLHHALSELAARCSEAVFEEAVEILSNGPWKALVELLTSPGNRRGTM